MSHKFGKASGPLSCTRLLGKRISAGKVQNRPVMAYCLLVIDDLKGTYVATTVRDGRFSPNFDPAKATYPLPPDDSEKWSEWEKKGYTTFNIEGFDVVKITEAHLEVADGVATLQVK